jgi:DNA modification methylase
MPGDNPATSSPRPRKFRGTPAPGATHHAIPRDEPGIKNPYVRFRPLKRPPVNLHASTLWDYPSQHYGTGTQGSQGYRGATPSHVIWNVIERTTKEGDLVVDPFCGSGTTVDVCRDLKRRCKAFDLVSTRDDIVRADARELSKHVDKETAHLVFFDPPYADNLNYSDDPACMGKLPFAGGAWSQAMGKVLDELWTITRPGGHIAGYVSDILHVEHKKQKQGGRELKSIDKEFQPLGLELANLAVARGFVFVDHVCVVRRGKALDDPRLRARALEDHFMLRGFSHLVLFQRPALKSAPATRAVTFASNKKPTPTSTSTSTSRPSSGRKPPRRRR